MTKTFRYAFLPLLSLAAAFSMGNEGCTGDEPAGPGVCTVDGTVYGNGDSGVPAPDGCNTCRCVDGALTDCTEIACPPGGQCFVDGVAYADGATGVPSPDGCNTCSCDDGRLTACTEIGCPPPGGACVVDGVSYPDGAGVPAPDGCNTCTCIDGLVTSCTEIACPPGGAACNVWGVSYDDGWAPAPDGCNTCDCNDGEVGNACTEAACGPIPIVPCTELASFESDGFWIDALDVTDDTLSATVSYSGGCEPHYFRLCYDPAFLESYPVQANLRLEHDGQDDPCEAVPTETRQFDLRPLRDAYRAGYAEEHATIILRLGDGATYTF